MGGWTAKQNELLRSVKEKLDANARLTGVVRDMLTITTTLGEDFWSGYFRLQLEGLPEGTHVEGVPDPESLMKFQAERGRMPSSDISVLETSYFDLRDFLRHARQRRDLEAPSRDPYRREFLRRVSESEDLFYAISDHIDTLRTAINLCVSELESKYPNLDDGAQSVNHEPIVRRVFIGHGRSKEWQDLAIFIQKNLKIEYEEFGLGVFEGKFNFEHLEDLLDKCGLAFLVMTGDDTRIEDSDTPKTTKHARENVIHEIGYCQGRLGRRNTIVVAEEGCAIPSNLDGQGRVQFKKGELAAKFHKIRGIVEDRFPSDYTSGDPGE
jgi:predicted nucleotide-binding protein